LLAMDQRGARSARSGRLAQDLRTAIPFDDARIRNPTVAA